jgi:hypothetical protein
MQWKGSGDAISINDMAAMEVTAELCHLKSKAVNP